LPFTRAQTAFTFTFRSHQNDWIGTGREGAMARIRKEDHARILEMVDVEEIKVAEVAATYGCTPANIYTLLGKLRRVARDAARESTQTPLALDEAPAMPETATTLEVTPPRPGPEAKKILAFERPTPSPKPSIEQVEAPEPARREAKLGAKLAKPGIGLVMRSADGEESLSPFRSLDDLLSAIKPILRATARSPEPVWFSLQPVDLGAIEIDAA
jgi:hypothetical protein